MKNLLGVAGAILQQRRGRVAAGIDLDRVDRDAGGLDVGAGLSPAAVSIEVWMVYQRFWVFKPSVSRMMTCGVVVVRILRRRRRTGRRRPATCQPMQQSDRWLVLPFGVMLLTSSSSPSSYSSAPSPAGRAQSCIVGREQRRDGGVVGGVAF